MAVTPFKFPPLSRKPKNVEIPKRLGVRAVVVDSSNNFLLTLQDILNPDLSLTLGKNATNKIIFQIFGFLIIAAGLKYGPLCETIVLLLFSFTSK